MDPSRDSVGLSEDQLEDLEIFRKMDTDGSGFIEQDELAKALEAVDIKVPPYEVRRMIDEHDINVRDHRLDFQEFVSLCVRLRREYDIGRKFSKQITPKAGLQVLAGMTEKSLEGTMHSVAEREMLSFSDWINTTLRGDPHCGKLLPLNIKTGDLYEKIEDGILLCKLINASVPNTIDIRAINLSNMIVYRKRENLVLAINSAESIGCNMTNVHPENLAEGKPHIVLGMIWQIIRLGLLSHVSLREVPNLLALKRDDESMDAFLRLSPEELLIRWVNYHLKNAGQSRRINNLTSDIKDAEVYTYLLNQIAPKDKKVTLQPLNAHDDTQRADMVLKEADKMDARKFVRTAQDITSGNQRLNLGFVANLFNMYPGLEEVELDEEEEDYEIYEETREEKTYRNWMNSMGVDPFVNYLYTDLSSGLIIFQLYDVIRPGIVNWTRVHKKFNKMKIRFEMLENCNYAVELGKELKFSLVGIGGEDILDGNRTLTLALAWQLMRAYTLAMLAQLSTNDRMIAEAEIADWANMKLHEAGKSGAFTSFSDKALQDGKIIIDLIDAIKPGVIEYEKVLPGSNDEEKQANASYAITSARKIGARVYALPEDICELKKNMIMTIFACLMVKDMERKPGEN